MTFLPLEDQEFLREKRIPYELITEEPTPGEVRNAILFPGFAVPGNLRGATGGSLETRQTCEVLVLVPKGYATTRLDSFYVLPFLRRADGQDPQNANNKTLLFKRDWQFWSRHLDDSDWRPGIDGMSTFIRYVERELRAA